MIKHRIRRLESLVNQCLALQARPRLPRRRLQTPQDVLDLLQEQMEAIRNETWADTVEKGRALAYLAGVARRVIEANTMAQRIRALETVLKQRKGTQS